MATKIISIKILILLFFNFVFIPLSQILTKIIGTPNDLIFYIFVLALFIPEMAVIISKSFRTWLKNAIENNDGVLDPTDLRETISYLGAYYCAKLFALGMLCDIFYTIEVNPIYVYMSFAGFAGTTGAIQLSKIFRN